MNQELIDFCDMYNLPIEHLGKVLKDPKVIPMIRGKAFEFSVCDYLIKLLNSSKWKVSKPFLNPQLGSHDEDVLIENILTGKRIRIECKLSAKGAYSFVDDSSIFKVKCMRSRTLGIELIKRLAPMRMVSPEQLIVHNDQYFPNDFDLVITSLANAFYSTNKDGIFVWAPSQLGKSFLEQKFGKGLSDKEYQIKAFFDMYVAKSSDLAITSTNNIVCTRKKCNNSTNCGFIPNYPIIKFRHNDLFNPINKWTHINNIESLLA